MKMLNVKSQQWCSGKFATRLATHRRCHHSPRCGQTLVEFVMVVVLFFFIAMFGLQWGYISIAKSLLNTGAHAAARKIAVEQDIKKARKAVFAYVEPLVESVDDVTVYVSNMPNNFGAAYKVRASMKLNLLPFPVTYGLFQDDIVTSPSTRETFSYSHTPPTRKNLMNAQGKSFNLQDDEMLSVVDSKFYGWKWVRYRWVVKVVRTSILGITHHTSYRGSGRYHGGGDPWPNHYFETKRYFPNEKKAPAWYHPPSWHMSGSHGIVAHLGGHKSHSAANMTPHSATGPPPKKFHDGTPIYGPKIYKWTLEVTKKGHRVYNQPDGQIHLYAWTTMSAD